MYGGHVLQIVATSLVDNPRVDIYIYRVAIMYGYKKNSGKPAAPQIEIYI